MISVLRLKLTEGYDEVARERIHGGYWTQSRVVGGWICLRIVIPVLGAWKGSRRRSGG